MSKAAWLEHIACAHSLARWPLVGCHLCGKPMDYGKSPQVAHFAAHCEEISLAALPFDEDIENEDWVESPAGGDDHLDM